MNSISPQRRHAASPVASSHTSSGRGIIVVAAVCLAALVLPLSFSGGAAATPAISRDLGGSAVAITWITNAFMLTFGSLLMAFGTLADRYGRKRIFTAGVALFVLTSLALSFAPSILIIDLLRAAQGIGGAAALAGGSAAMAQEFEGSAKIRAFSLLGTTFGIGLAFGPVISGLLIENFSWRSVFATSTAIGVLALLFGVPRMHESKDPHATRLDWQGVLSFTAMLSFFTFALIQGPSSGWTSPIVIGLLLLAAATFGLFLLAEMRGRRPMLDLTLFRYPRFVGVQLLPIATCYAYVVLLILLPLRFIGVDGRSELEAGLLMMALSAPMLIVPSAAATLTRWLSPSVISSIGLVVAAGGLVWLGWAPSAAVETTVPALLLIGTGAGLPWGLMDGLSVTVVPKERAGMASGIFNTMKVANEGVALATVTAVLTALTAGNLRAVSGMSTATTGEVAQRMATGGIADAALLVPGVALSDLAAAYGSAFSTLTQVLAAATVFLALAVLLLLGRPEKGR